MWVRVSSGSAGVTVVEVAGLTRSEHATVADELDELAAQLGTVRPTAPTATPPGAEKETR